jgi:Mg2+/Co2+ transporter CorB
MPSAIVDPVYDIEVSDDNQGYGIIDKEDPIEMMTRKLEREKRRKKAKKPTSLIIEQIGQESNGKDCVKVVHGAVQVLQSVQEGIFINFPAVGTTNFYIRS